MLYKIDIYLSGDELYAETYLQLLYSKEECHLRLRFSEIIEYSFLYNSNYSFYNVERYKFFKTGDGIYISFDPFEEDETVAENDQDYILSKNVQGFLISGSGENVL